MNVVRTNEWQGIKQGDQVAVTGEEKGTFTFVAHVQRDDGVAWIDVFGGTKNRGTRSFNVDRVQPLGAMSFGTRCRLERERFGWSREDVKKKTGLTLSAIARVETKGFGTPDEHDLLSQALGIRTKEDA